MRLSSLLERSWTILLLAISLIRTAAFTNHCVSQNFCLSSTRTRRLASPKSDPVAQDQLERTAAHLKKLDVQKRAPVSDNPEVEAAYREYLKQPANSLKELLKAKKLPRNGRKPDLALRLAHSDVNQEKIEQEEEIITPDETYMAAPKTKSDKNTNPLPVKHFAGLSSLSETAGKALANFEQPTLIQTAAIPALMNGESCILHAPTGSGKSLAFLLPVTEQLWSSRAVEGQDSLELTLIITPTRELASQIAGIATMLAPPGSVRFISRPSNLSASKDRNQQPRLFVGSAKAVMHSLYGDGSMPAPPTPKPAAIQFLGQIRTLVMDEVDRLLLTSSSKTTRAVQSRHEKPAAILCSAVARLTLGQAQVVAASATTGRPLRRELARVLGLSPQDCPPVIVGQSRENLGESSTTTSRAVTIPDTVEHYVFSTGESRSPGELLIGAFKVIQSLVGKDVSSPPPILLVLSKGFGMNTQNSIGALKHFGCQPEPQNLLDALEARDDKEMLEVFREVSGADGVGRSSSPIPKGYLYVTGEDSVRGLHLDGLDYVIVVGRANGPDEYTHIAGRTGRAGRPGKVINILNDPDATKMVSWSRMLGVDFESASLEQIESWRKASQ